MYQPLLGRTRVTKHGGQLILILYHVNLSPQQVEKLVDRPFKFGFGFTVQIDDRSIFVMLYLSAMVENSPPVTSSYCWRTTGRASCCHFSSLGHGGSYRNHLPVAQWRG